MLRHRGLGSIRRAAVLGCALALMICLPASAALWPDRFGGFARTSSMSVTPSSDNDLWEEYGLAEAEQAEFTSASGGKLAATAYRFHDSVGAFGAFLWQRPPNARASSLSDLAVESGADLWVAFGNYLFRFSGVRPQRVDLKALFHGLGKLERSSLPVFPTRLPAGGLVPNSSRHVLGPVALAKFAPAIPAAMAGFQFSAEAHLARYRTSSGEMLLVVFAYPTPHIAREQLSIFQKLPGAMVQRSGPLVSVIPSPGDTKAAEKLLSMVRYEAKITWNERVMTRRDNVGDLILNIFLLTGILLIFALVSGLAFGGVRIAARRLLGWSPASENVITLDLSDRK
ncbi:MAG: hypothetical protein M1541_06630 [Acidobacteria bacterium]|nr:hypothetical protein [Acidobacteriota bacterium]